MCWHKIGSSVRMVPRKSDFLPQSLAWTATRATPRSRKTPGTLAGGRALIVNNAPLKRIRPRSLSSGECEKRALVPPLSCPPTAVLAMCLVWLDKCQLLRRLQDQRHASREPLSSHHSLLTLRSLQPTLPCLQLLPVRLALPSFPFPQAAFPTTIVIATHHTHTTITEEFSKQQSHHSRVTKHRA